MDFLTDPLTTSYLTGVATHLTTGILGALGKSLRQKIQGTPREQALQRCCQAGMAVLLPEDESTRKTVQPILQDFFARPDVQIELARLVRSQPLDRELLVERFEEATEEHDLAGFDFARRLADFVEAFLQAAEQEKDLVDILQIGQFRQVNARLLNLVTDAAAIRRAVESMKASTGDVTAVGNIQTENLVTGTQVINHIVHVYQDGGGAWDEADYRAALDRYLGWMGAAMGRVVLRGINRGGQQAVDLSLQEVYVPLAAEALPEAREALKRGLARPAVGGGSALAHAEAELVAAHTPAGRVSGGGGPCLEGVWFLIAGFCLLAPGSGIA